MSEMILREKQCLFAKLIPRLIDKFYSEGYEVTFGDAWSKPEYKAHMVLSVHYLRLAIDFNLFKDGTYITDSLVHQPFGEFWESLHPLCRWGGRFKDGNHYSMEHEGRK